MMNQVLRKATLADAGQLLEWRNDDGTRNNSNSTGLVSLDAHLAWLTKSLADTGCRFYIMEVNKEAVGTIRDNLVQTEGCTKQYLSWTIAPVCRGKGYGTEMLHMFLKENKGCFYAEIKPFNQSSIKMVEQNQFVLLGKAGENLVYTRIVT